MGVASIVPAPQPVCAGPRRLYIALSFELFLARLQQYIELNDDLLKPFRVPFRSCRKAQRVPTLCLSRHRAPRLVVIGCAIGLLPGAAGFTASQKIVHQSAWPAFPQDIAHWCSFSGTEVPFSNGLADFSLMGEQFWGRAARASRDSKEFRGARYFWL